MSQAETDTDPLWHKTLEAIHEGAVDSIITIDESGLIETVNPATLSMFGYQSSELIGKNINCLMPSPYYQEHDRYLRDYRETNQRRIIGIGREVSARKKDGTIFPIYLSVSEVRIGDHRIFAGFIRDLTELKQSEAQEVSLGRIIENSLNEVFIFNPKTLQFVQVNRGGRDNLGYELSELLAMSPLNVCPQFDLSRFRAMLQPLMDGTVEELEISALHQRQDGSCYDSDIHLQMATYRGETVVVAIGLDVTEKREAEKLVQQQRETMQAELSRQVAMRTAELRVAQEELVRNEKFSTLGKVSGGIAHEIRNPLNAVKMSAYFLLNAKQPAPEKVREHLERIDRQVTLVDQVVTALTDVAKLPEAQRSPVAMEPLLRQIVGSLELPDRIEVRFDFPPETPSVLADDHQLSIAFRNLIRNARDAISESGTITLSAKVLEKSVIFLVIDSGSGIPPENLQQVIEPLFTTKARGMGLGLSITRAIVEKNLGKLRVASQVGIGSEFSVELMRADIDADRKVDGESES